jgi:hypothetical protein
MQKNIDIIMAMFLWLVLATPGRMIFSIHFACKSELCHWEYFFFKGRHRGNHVCLPVNMILPGTLFHKPMLG